MRLLLISISCFFFFHASSQKAALLKVHFIYGSKPLKEFKHTQEKWFGGIMGGHVGIEGDSGKIADFLKDGKFHVFSKKQSRHSRYNKGSVNNFYKIFGGHPDSVKKAIVYIPVTLEQKQQFDSIITGYLNETPYDYAFIGMRCAAAAYDLLGQLDIVPRYSRSKTYWKIFYPKKLRKRLFKRAEREGWIVDECAGTCQRKWEKD